MNPGDRVIWYKFKRGYSPIKTEAEIIEIKAHRIKIKVLNTGKSTYVEKENLKVIGHK